MMSAGGTYLALPEPFHVLATQNPIEQEGTYPLPEAQLDRFLLQIDVGYPDLDSERRMLIATTGVAEEQATQAMTAAELIAAQRLIRRIPVGGSVVEAILAMVRAGRPETSDVEAVQRHVVWGPGPRASQALMLACRARAVLGGRLALHERGVGLAVLAQTRVDELQVLAHQAQRRGMDVEAILLRDAEDAQEGQPIGFEGVVAGDAEATVLDHEAAELARSPDQPPPVQARTPRRADLQSVQKMRVRSPTSFAVR